MIKGPMTMTDVGPLPEQDRRVVFEAEKAAQLTNVCGC